MSQACLPTSLELFTNEPLAHIYAFWPTISFMRAKISGVGCKEKGLFWDLQTSEKGAKEAAKVMPYQLGHKGHS